MKKEDKLMYEYMKEKLEGIPNEHLMAVIRMVRLKEFSPGVEKLYNDIINTHKERLVIEKKQPQNQPAV